MSFRRAIPATPKANDALQRLAVLRLSEAEHVAGHPARKLIGCVGTAKLYYV